MVREKFPTGRPNFFRSFSAVDIITGRSIGIFSGGKGQTTPHLMTTTSFDSDKITTIDSRTIASAGVAEKGVDVDFDSVFGIPTVIEGEAIVNVSAGFQMDGGGGTGTVFVIARVFRRPTTGGEIELVTGTSTSVASATGTTPISKRFAINMTIPKTNFKIGDKLRLTLEIWVNRSIEAATIVSGLGHDGGNFSLTIC